MARFVAGDVLVVPFPYSDMSGAKLRPALVLAAWPNHMTADYLVCLISSQSKAYALSLALAAKDFIRGGLPLPVSYIRPWYLIAVDEQAIVRRAGRVQPALLGLVLDAVVARLKL